ncbi:response regulator [Roseateles sp. NT4]|uniref:response regulator n=1 Tax=Roseateles sp. NT4 TaxID=3453715 RepID=UPI003EE844B3
MLISDPSDAAPRVLLAGAVPEGAATLLREANYDVRSAATGAALLRLAGSAPAPGLILLGETVADQHGLDLLSRLRDDATAHAIPVLFVSEGGDEELALALGASDCLSLPLRPLVLLARVQAQLELHRLLALSNARARPLGVAA